MRIFFSPQAQPTERKKLPWTYLAMTPQKYFENLSLFWRIWKLFGRPSPLKLLFWSICQSAIFSHVSSGLGYLLKQKSLRSQWILIWIEADFFSIMIHGQQQIETFKSNRKGGVSPNTFFFYIFFLFWALVPLKYLCRVKIKFFGFS